MTCAGQPRVEGVAGTFRPAAGWPKASCHASKMSASMLEDVVAKTSDKSSHDVICSLRRSVVDGDLADHASLRMDHRFGFLLGLLSDAGDARAPPVRPRQLGLPLRCALPCTAWRWREPMGRGRSMGGCGHPMVAAA